MNTQTAVQERNSYDEVVSAIRRSEPSPVSVPHLAQLLGVKTTTLNARFRREKTTVQTIGRTNFILPEVALRLAEQHKYALMGWFTLKQASQLTGIKSATIKARCENGRLEGHIDLTKKLRISPAALDSLSELKLGARRRKHPACASDPVLIHNRLNGSDSPKLKPRAGFGATISTTPPPSLLPPPPKPQIRLITRTDYGLPEIEDSTPLTPQPLKPSSNGNRRTRSRCLSYNPENPFSVSECAVGRRIRYDQYDGTIVRIIDDPFNPQIQAAFPAHQHPLMREVMLIVGRRRG